MEEERNTDRIPVDFPMELSTRMRIHCAKNRKHENLSLRQFIVEAVKEKLKREKDK